MGVQVHASAPHSPTAVRIKRRKYKSVWCTRVHVCVCASSCLDGLGAAQAVRDDLFTPWIAASHERIQKPSPSSTLICDNISCWEQYLCYILSLTSCEHLARRTHAYQHHAEHRAWRKSTALPNERACGFPKLINREMIGK